VRAVYDASYTVPTMIKELLMRVKPPQDKAAEQGSPRTSFGSGTLPPTADGDPMGSKRSLNKTRSPVLTALRSWDRR